jgi:crotonobetainyl-CoA:carnitine CoA-transferase CaiB-like acyl-CoA transferase
MTTQVLPKPLEGVRVLDLTTVLAGPHATRMLLGLGAEVVKVELPDGGDPARGFGAVCLDDCGAFFLQQNVGKRLLGLDWRNPRGATILRRLVASFDVLVDDCRRGMMDSLGLAYDVLSPDHRLIQCTITPFGLSGTLADRPGDGLSAEALAGVLGVTGYPDRGPVPLGFMFGDFTAGSFALASITTALLSRERTGLGCHIDLAAYDAVLAVHDSSLTEYNWTKGMVERSRPGSDREVLVPYGIYPGNDGYIAIVATSNSAFAKLGAAIGAPEWATVQQYFTQAGRSLDREKISEQIRSWLRDVGSVWEAERILSERGIIAAVVRDLPRVLEEPLMSERKIIANVRSTGGATIRTLNTPFRFGLPSHGIEGAITPGEVGRDTGAILREHGIDDRTIEDLEQAQVLSAVQPRRT